jgi:hypothetical protein
MAQRYGGVTQPIANDHFAARETLSGSVGSINRNTVGATKEPGEPNHAGFPGGASIWFTWRAPASGEVTLDTLGSNFDTMLHVYQGSSVTGLTSIVGNDDIVVGVELASRVTFTAVGGQTYQIAIDGWGGESGTVTLNWHAPAGAAADQVRADFNGDGQSDLVWQDNIGGNRAIWLMNGTSYAGERFLPSVPTQWQIAATGDFNNDGHADLLWQNSSTGQRAIWLMNRTSYMAERFLPTVPTEWQIAGAGDFNNDRQPDIVWQNTRTGQRAIWLMSGTTFASERFLPVVGLDWQIAAVADFDGDGGADLVWENTVTGQRAIWTMTGSTWSGERFLPTISTQWQIVGAADFSADAQTDLVWQNNVTGQRAIWLMNGTTWAGERFLPAVPTQWDIRNR